MLFNNKLTLVLPGRLENMPVFRPEEIPQKQFHKNLLNVSRSQTFSWQEAPELSVFGPGPTSPL